MEVDPQSEDNLQHYFKFSNVLKDYIVDSINSKDKPDPLDLIREFRSFTGNKALQCLSKNDYDLKSSNDWELEAKFWHLLELLLSFRTSEDTLDLESSVINGYNSSAAFEKDLLHKDKQLYQIWIIMVWLQENITLEEKPKNLPTSKWSNSVLTGVLKSADLDAPLRNVHNQIDVKDKEEDHIFYKHIYNLLLAGQFEAAFSECKSSDNITLCMIFCGMQEYLNPKIDTQFAEEFEVQQGVKKHALWRRTVYNLSQSPNLDPYERAIYNYLSGTMPSDEILKETDWDSELLLNLNQILQINIENYMLQNSKIEQSELIYPLPDTAMSMENVLNLVSSKHQKESEHPIRVLIGAVILNTLSSVLHSSVEMLLDIVKGIETSNDLLDEPYLLRIVTHLSIILDIITPGIVSNDDKVKLITAYISILKLQKLYDLIPVYVCFLNESDSLEAYSFILCTLEDPHIRQKQLKLMSFLNLPVSNILKRTTQRVFVETEANYTPSENISITQDISLTDRHLIFSVEWLIEGKLYDDSVEAIVAFARRLLINGKIKSLEYFMDHNNIEEILQNYKIENISMDDDEHNDNDDTKVKEIKQYQALISGFKHYEEWQKSIKLLNSESNIPSLIEKFQEYSKNTVELIKSFLVELTDDINNLDHTVLFEIRSLYTPYLIIELHKGLVEAANLLNIPTFINEALSFTNLVANETDKIYLLFQSSGKLKEYLQLVAYTATLVE
ncbi:hypothetical protein KAFR_0A06860 [Kazachstania africana CBS 2517]|uniref:Nuclear pore complex protein n=1 Tax=Kazachstania africana (strain ATCC 22294 / BCRC 22015 / CBS 2517 / CECT 1963 / NBRC 1671 / NRRL Y-8276) TaxID=1071382 RepID=H2AP21_KAZAF|nr:hypothetical protein KAFR_0A06860 [Kazachstania africana CBS 2517]CCF56121.1 hypothetical protein KAFR_0A06860 [Kazachstania africana CBS 2517]